MKLVKLMLEGGKASIVRLDLEGLKLPHIPVDPKPLLDFDITTYRAFRFNAKPEDWENVQDVTNMFFKELDDNDKTLLAETIWMMHYKIREVINPENIPMSDESQMEENGNKIHAVISQLADMLYTLNEQIHLYDKAKDFAVKHVPIVDKPEINGQRPQDTEEMTFRRSHKFELTAIAILCKVMSVITGTILEAFKETGIDDKRFTDSYCYYIYQKLLESPSVSAIARKLENYVTTNIDKMNKKSRDGLLSSRGVADIIRGETASVTESRTFASLFTRKFVNIALLKDDADIMTFIYSCIKNTAQNPSSGGGGKDKPNYYLRYTPAEENNDSDEGNDSIMETESIQSEKTADTNLLVGLAVDTLVERFCSQHGITADVLNDVTGYYLERHHLQLDITNSYILANVFGDELLGAKSIELLTTIDLAKLIGVLQIYLVQEGFTDLVHLVSAVPTGVHKNQLEITGEEKTLKSAFANNAAYRNCATRYITQVGDLRWDTNLRLLIDTVTGTNYKVNTAPAIWELMNQAPDNGIDYVPKASLSESICTLILQSDPHSNYNEEI